MGRDRISGGITLVTPTADRPVSFRLCEQWMKRQDYNGDLQWVVCDGGVCPAECTMGQTYVRRDVRQEESPTQNFRNNLLGALREAKYDKVLFIEDDDWYSAKYVSQMFMRLMRWDIVGEARSRYYFLLSRRYIHLNNTQHCSLCQTGIKGRAVDWLIEFLEQRIKNKGIPYVDMELWKWAKADGKVQRRFWPETVLATGIKQVPGKKTIHYISQFHPERLISDPDWSQLRSWTCPYEADDYIKIYHDTTGL